MNKKFFVDTKLFLHAFSGLIFWIKWFYASVQLLLEHWKSLEWSNNVIVWLSILCRSHKAVDQRAGSESCVHSHFCPG